MNSKRKHNLSIDQVSSTSRRLNRSILAETPKKQVSPFKKILQIPNIRSYVAIEKLKLGKEALEKIKESLDIDHLSQVNVQERIKNNDYYINYEKNPFMHKVQKEKDDIGLLPQKNRSFGIKSYNIVDSINNLKKKSQYKQIMSKLVKEDSQSNYIHKVMQDKQREEDKAIKKKRYEEKSILIHQENSLKSQRKVNEFQEFEKIVNIKQESFYKSKNRNQSFNIFKILTDDTDNSFYLSSSILKKVYFCEDSTVTKANAKKITNVFKDISFISRLFINNLGYLVPKDYKMVTADLKTIVDQIQFSDFMVLSSGFLEPEIVQSYMFEEVKNNKRGGGGVDEQGSSLVDEEDQVYYLDNQKNASVLFQVERHDKAQIQTYIDHPLSKIENSQLVLSQMHRNQLLKYLELEQNSKVVNVQDRQLLRQINQKKKKALIQQFEARIRMQDGSIDKIIRLNKRRKDRIQNIKNKIVIQTIQQQKSIQKKIRRQSKHKSLSAWR